MTGAIESICCGRAQWEFEDNHGAFRNTYVWLSEQLEEAYQARRFTFTIHSGEDWSWDYDLREMTQQNYWRTKPGALRNLQRTTKQDEFSVS